MRTAASRFQRWPAVANVVDCQITVKSESRTVLSRLLWNGNLVMMDLERSSDKDTLAQAWGCCAGGDDE